MKLDGQLEKAQFENLASTSPTPTPLGRVYVDTTDATQAIPRMHDGTEWTALLKRRVNYTTVTTVATLGADTEYLRCDATSAAFAVTLPTAASMTGKTVLIQKIDVTFNAITVTGNGAETIDGSNTTTLNSKLEWIRILSTGAAWVTVNWGYYQGKTAFTPTGSWITNTTYTGYWYRVGNRIWIEYHLALGGAPTAAALTLNLPTGVTVDTTQILSTTAGVAPVGFAGTYDVSATTRYIAFAQYSSSSAVALYRDVGDATLNTLTQVAPFTYASGDSVDAVVTGLPATNWRG